MWKLREDLFQALTCNCSLLSPGYVYINFVRPDEAKLFLFAIETWKILLLHCWSLFTVHGTARNWKIISIEQKISHNERSSICLVFLEITEELKILVCWNLTRTRCTMDNFPVTQYLSRYCSLFIVHRIFIRLQRKWHTRMKGGEARLHLHSMDHFFPHSEYGEVGRWRFKELTNPTFHIIHVQMGFLLRSE